MSTYRITLERLNTHTKRWSQVAVSPEFDTGNPSYQVESWGTIITDRAQNELDIDRKTRQGAEQRGGD